MKNPHFVTLRPDLLLPLFCRPGLPIMRDLVWMPIPCWPAPQASAPTCALDASPAASSTTAYGTYTRRWGAGSMSGCPQALRSLPVIPEKPPSLWLWVWAVRVLETISSEKLEMVGFLEVTAGHNWVTDINEPRFSCGSGDRKADLGGFRAGIFTSSW